MCAWGWGVLNICSLTLSMKSVLSHARNVPSVSPSSINLSNNHYCLERRQKHSIKSAASFNISRRSTLGGRDPHTWFWFFRSSYYNFCIDALRNYLHCNYSDEAKKAQKKQRARVSWIILCILNALSTKHDNYKSSKVPRGKINPKSDSCVFCLNSNENIGFVESLKSDLRWQSKQKTSCCWSLKLVSAKALHNDSSFIDSWFTLNECQRSTVPNTGGLMRDDLYWKHFCLSAFLQHLTCALNTPARRDFCNI